ncbi:polysaccharide biosynthesis protein [Paraglaciecola sp.]|uniref:lipopolysaccharide biosynthesis protein n=1 Tax=Paraglaciecola sp. TaxID=1920173 RepID=UPI0030F3DDBA
MAKSLARNSLYTLLANVSVAASNWLLLVVIAKQFDSGQLGQFVLAISICAPAFLFASFKVRTLLVVDATWQFKLEEYALARLLANALVTFVVLMSNLLGWLDLSSSSLVLVLLYKWCDAWSEFCQSYMRRLHKFEVTALSLTVRSVFTILIVALVATFSDSFELLLTVWMLVAFAFAIIDSWFMWRLTLDNESSAFKWLNLLQLGKLQRVLVFYRQHLTLAAALVISSLFVNLPNILLSYQLNLEAAGTFATISYFLVAGGILINSLSQVGTPKFSELYRQGNYAGFVQLVKKLCLVGVVIGISGVVVALLFGAYFLRIFYNQDIAQYFDVLNWVMLAAAVRYVYIFLGTALAAVQQFHVQTKIYATGLVTLLFSSYFLIAANGLTGAAQAMLFATLVELTLFIIVSRNALRNAFNQGRATK